MCQLGGWIIFCKNANPLKYSWWNEKFKQVNKQAIIWLLDWLQRLLLIDWIYTGRRYRTLGVPFMELMLLWTDKVIEHITCIECYLGPVWLLRHDALARILANGSTTFHWKLRCHWLKFLRQLQIAVVRQGPRPILLIRIDFNSCTNIHSKLWADIPYLSFEWISTFIPKFSLDITIYPC